MRPAFLRGLIAPLLAALCAWAADPPAHVVVRPVANLFSGPGADADVVSQALLGARVAELERRDGWVRIQGDDGYAGWAEASALRALKAGEGYPAGAKVEVDVLGANVYREPDVTRHAPVLTAPFGAVLERAPGPQDSARWLGVRLPDGRAAWIQSGDVRTDFRPIGIEASLDLARRFLGVNYTWGGCSSFGFDCSGFTQAILRRRGAILPRDANVQAEWPGLAPVKDRADLEPGDLLFFGKDKDHITHTGMYLGKGAFIHDTPRIRPMVQISDLGSPEWSAILVAMRRLK
ncbi:C40 family peptidase [Mesoterricola silvestris]|uniref:NlpC/P60 domain-containing protein n=1 Tax=Mesoterricola silvestris TaxID=2927979 RepID=A0AA48K980_9BACT|nr:C40 family peptidase [Mesoterricola silvestris]BDU72845.1 hypothetical protein METEAL_20190 [Mesoterricola silvestris]